jgi:hypothetical protein
LLASPETGIYLVVECWPGGRNGYLHNASLFFLDRKFADFSLQVFKFVS